ncbi:MAG: hypothetical protein H7259_04825 [Cytophagales bacterium]|nr:hypothetical protein [Cytophaga sp.]
MFKELGKGLLICLLYAIVPVCYAQKYTKTAKGYKISYPELHINVDTIQNIVHLHTYLRGQYHFNVRQVGYMYFKPDILLYFGKVITFKYHPATVIIITKKRFRKEFKI